MAATRELQSDIETATIAFSVNGHSAGVSCSPSQRLSRVLREELGLTGTKVGCDAGDCGACTVLLDGEPVCACLVAVGQAEGSEITTVEGLQQSSSGSRLQQSFLTHGAAQCGACTPGMLLAAMALLNETDARESEVMDALGGVLCRCTGYRKIIAAVMDATSTETAEVPAPAGNAVGHDLSDWTARESRRHEIFGADEIPAGALAVRVIRCPYHRARFRFGDLDAFVRNAAGNSFASSPQKM